MFRYLHLKDLKEGGNNSNEIRNKTEKKIKSFTTCTFKITVQHQKNLVLMINSKYLFENMFQIETFGLIFD